MTTVASAAAGAPAATNRPGTARRRLLVFVATVATLAVLVLLSLAIGQRPVAVSDVVASLFAFDARVVDQAVVRGERLPRTVLGLLVGAALAVAGTVMQGMTRNVLADPAILGLNGGAALAVVVAITLLGSAPLSVYVWFALAGALCAGTLVYLLASAGPSGATPLTLALAGATLAALTTALTTGVALLDDAVNARLSLWTLGSTTGRGLDVVAQAGPFVLAGLALAGCLGSALNAIAMGEDLAASLGQRVAWTRGLAVVAVALLVGGAVAAAGPIAFVGLVVPHVARALLGPDYRAIIAYALVAGPVLLLGADVLGRVLSPTEADVRVGVVMGVVGAPLFVALVRRTRMAEL